MLTSSENDAAWCDSSYRARVERLRGDDIITLTDVVQEAYRAPTLHDFPALAITLVARLVRSEITSFNDIDPTGHRAIVVMEPPVSSFFDGALERFAALQGQNPLIRNAMETGDGSARKFSDFLSLAEFRELEIYRELYRRIGVDYQMAVTLPAALPRIIGIAVNRSAPRPDFDERDRTILNLARPHLAQAYEHVRLRDLMTDRLATVGRILTDQGARVIVLEDPPADATPGAQVLLLRYFGRPGRATPFPERVMRWIADQRSRMQTQAAGAVPEPFRTLSAVRGDRRLIVRFVPGGAQPDALVLHERAAGSADAELGLLGLTPREAEILRLLSTGATNAAIGAQLHIAPGTVKKHLDSIYRKLGVNGRVQAVSMGLELLPIQ